MTVFRVTCVWSCQPRTFLVLGVNRDLTSSVQTKQLCQLTATQTRLTALNQHYNQKCKRPLCTCRDAADDIIRRGQLGTQSPVIAPPYFNQGVCVGATSETAGWPIWLNPGPVPPHTQISMCWNTVASCAFQSCCCATPAWLTALAQKSCRGGGGVRWETVVVCQLINSQNRAQSRVKKKKRKIQIECKYVCISMPLHMTSRYMILWGDFVQICRWNAQYNTKHRWISRSEQKLGHFRYVRLYMLHFYWFALPWMCCLSSGHSVLTLQLPLDLHHR